MASGSKSGMTAGLWLAGAVSLLALPSAVLAFATDFEAQFAPTSASSLQAIDSAETPPRLARAIPIRSLAKGSLYPFTPAGTPNRPDRSVTVAVRVDSGAPQMISVRGIRVRNLADAGSAPLRIAPTAFNLGVSRGYHNFAQNLVPPADGRKPDLADLSKFSIASGGGAGADPASRLRPRIVVDEKQAAGRAPRTFAGDGDDQVDVGGSYRLTRNLNVTAGVRYSQSERERLHPLTDGKQDNQAVYVGTQFRF
ncbi:hypothetical protein WG901_11680 [Novosphingobium sp. PS1R-30]|uniref:Porin domain-containing protein n=1 Tax=Novosphingobium anseongense TaxID=3133436 RepID=A0ABU8RW53_9SPHN